MLLQCECVHGHLHTRLDDCPDPRAMVYVESPEHLWPRYVTFASPLGWRAQEGNCVGFVSPAQFRFRLAWDTHEIAMHFQQDQTERDDAVSYIVRFNRCPAFMAWLEAAVAVAQPLPCLSPQETQTIQGLVNQLDQRATECRSRRWFG
jgi:hypothetical protein